MAKVKKISYNHYCGKVYDIQVEKDHSYTIEDCVVHNSGAGSLLLYVLGVMKVDPIKFNLLFERFLDASRLEEIIKKGLKITAAEMPDVDIDTADRESIKRYFRQKYGVKNMVVIGTLGKLKNKNTLLDLARSNDIDKDEAYKITQGDMAKWDAKTESTPVSELRKKSSDFNSFLNQHPEVCAPWDRLRGSIAAYGQHAGGILVSDSDLTEVLPVRIIEGELVSCWIEGLEDRELSVMGYVKMDILAVDAMAIAEETIQLINKRHGSCYTLADIPLEDKKAFKTINDGDNYGIWQLDGNLGMSVIKTIGGIKCFNDLSAVSALMRPASLQNKFHVKFGERRAGNEKYTIPKRLEPYLADTYGLPIYQEAAYHVAYHMAGFNIVDSYKFMKTLYKGKMKGDAVPYWHDKFVAGCQKLVETEEISKEYPEIVFNELLAFQGYGFNASHSISYAHYSLYGLWFKAHYYHEFMTVLLNHTKRTDKINGTPALMHRISFAKKMRLDISAPGINNSQSEWIVDYDNSLRMPFIDVNLVDKEASDEIVSHQPYKNFDDFMGKINTKIINVKKVEQLIFGGCFKQFGDVATIWNYWNNNYIQKKEVKVKDENAEQISFFNFDDDNESDVASDVLFSNKQLKEKELEAIGFNTGDDLLKKYEKFIAADKKMKLMQEIEFTGAVYPFVFAKIVGITSFTSKTGEGCKWVNLSDGRCNAKMFIKDGDFFMNNKSLAKGNVCKIPVTVSENDRQTYFFSNNRELTVFGKED